MESLLKNIEKILLIKDVKEITIKKVDDSKVEIWEGPIYAGRQKVDYSKKTK